MPLGQQLCAPMIVFSKIRVKKISGRMFFPFPFPYVSPLELEIRHFEPDIQILREISSPEQSKRMKPTAWEEDVTKCSESTSDIFC